ncbi:hypothetical protein [Streptomyces sp. H27-H5]|uniref:hypothetical protein n=1 Tax=Streptomyces sp. H27-H5 TaxID=2996460 RepID=UPI0022703C75|nr:hypothetical protein [Streptomyces sp. H27-H5]MCY0960810.1 hypothetical protein [Streptomyces sp. H27-H5]
MNTKRVDAAAGVLSASMKLGKRLPATLAYDLEAAQLLQSPETAAEMAALRDVSALQERVIGDACQLLQKRRWEIRGRKEYGQRLRTENERLRARVSELETERHETNAALSDAAEALRASRDRIAELERALALDPDPIAYGPRGYRCGCGKDAHSNLTPCRPEPGALAEQRHQFLDLDVDSTAPIPGACLYPYLRTAPLGGTDAR